MEKEGLSDKTTEEIHSYLKGEVAVFNDYIMGNVYGFEIEETGDSCFGFYGDDHAASGLLEHAQDSIDASQEETLKPGM